MRTAAAQVDTSKKPEEHQEELPFESKAPEVEQDDDVEIVHEPAPKKKVEEPDANAALLKQIEDLKKSEQIAREEADRAKREAREERAKFEDEVRASRQTVEQAQLETIETALAAAKNDAEAAERDIKLAIEQADPQAQAEAYRRLTRAETQYARLEDGKVELEERIKQAAEKVKIEAESRKNDPIEAMNIPAAGKDWLRKHPEYATNQRLNIKLQAAHWDALDAGHRAFSTEYFEEVEKIIGLRKVEKSKAEDDDDPIEEREVVRPNTETRRTPIVSAPVSREVPSGGAPKSKTRIYLTKEEVEHARASGITEAEYAKQKQVLAERKANGHYGDR